MTTNDDILCIKQKQVTAKIYIYSLSAGYLKFKHVDGVISKRVSLGDIKALWQILMSQTPQESGRYNVGMTTRLRTPARLSSEEASVLRGYSCNLKTKQIARVKRGTAHGLKLVHGVVLIKVNQPDVTPQLTGDLLGFEITGIAAQYAGLLAGQPRRGA